jgi:hypothetical protein
VDPEQGRKKRRDSGSSFREEPRANPEIPILHKYDGHVPESFWQKFSKADIPKEVTTKVDTGALETKVEESKDKMLPHQFAWAKRALDFLKHEAPAYQKTVLPACSVMNTPSTSQYGLEVADTIATWVKKGFVSEPFREPPLPKFRVNCLMAVNQGTKVRPIRNISLPENSSFNDNVDKFELEKLECVQLNPSVMLFWLWARTVFCTSLT